MKGRVVFLIRLRDGIDGDRFLEAYDAVRYDVARGVKGHILDQVCQSTEDPQSWLVTSEWEDIDDFYAWERTPEHREQARPMRECMAEAQSLKFVVYAETGPTARQPAGA